MPVFFPIAFLAVQAAIFAFVASISGIAAYFAMVVAPLLAAPALTWRAQRETGPSRTGWRVLALSLAIWSLGGFGNFWYEVVEARRLQMNRDPMLAFHLAAVPISFLLAIEMGADMVDIGKTIRPHPTLGGSLGMAAEVAHGSCTDLPPPRR